MVFTFIAAAFHGCLVALGFSAAFAIFAAAIFLALFHFGFHVFAGATGLTILRFTFVHVFAATGHGILGVGRSVMATAFRVFHVSHVVMAAALGFWGWSRVRRRRSGGCVLCPASHRHGQSQGQDQNKYSEFHKSSLSML